MALSRPSCPTLKEALDIAKTDGYPRRLVQAHCVPRMERLGMCLDGRQFFVLTTSPHCIPLSLQMLATRLVTSLEHVCTTAQHTTATCQQAGRTPLWVQLIDADRC